MLVALRSLPGHHRNDWIEEHKVDIYQRMLPSSPSAPHGAVVFIARQGGMRTISVDEVVEVR